MIYMNKLKKKLNSNIKDKYNDYADLFDKVDGNQREAVKKETELLLFKISSLTNDILTNDILTIRKF